MPSADRSTVAHPVRGNQLVNDLRDLIAIIDRRLIQLRQHGNQEALRKMEDIRYRMVQLQQTVDAAAKQ
jgi:hypothetical protein